MLRHVSGRHAICTWRLRYGCNESPPGSGSGADKCNPHGCCGGYCPVTCIGCNKSSRMLRAPFMNHQNDTRGFPKKTKEQKKRQTYVPIQMWGHVPMFRSTLLCRGLLQENTRPPYTANVSTAPSASRTVCGTPSVEPETGGCFAFLEELPAGESGHVDLPRPCTPAPFDLTPAPLCVVGNLCCPMFSPNQELSFLGDPQNGGFPFWCSFKTNKTRVPSNTRQTHIAINVATTSSNKAILFSFQLIWPPTLADLRDGFPRPKGGTF